MSLFSDSFQRRLHFTVKSGNITPQTAVQDIIQLLANKGNNSYLHFIASNELKCSPYFEDCAKAMCDYLISHCNLTQVMYYNEKCIHMQPGEFMIWKLINRKSTKNSCCDILISLEILICPF